MQSKLYCFSVKMVNLKCIPDKITARVATNLLKQALFTRHSYEDPVILLVSHLGVKTLCNKTSRRTTNDFTLQRPTNLHQVGLQKNLAFMYAVYYQSYSKRMALSQMRLGGYSYYLFYSGTAWVEFGRLQRQWYVGQGSFYLFFRHHMHYRGGKKWSNFSLLSEK